MSLTYCFLIGHWVDARAAQPWSWPDSPSPSQRLQEL